MRLCALVSIPIVAITVVTATVAATVGVTFIVARVVTGITWIGGREGNDLVIIVIATALSGPGPRIWT